MTDPKSSNLGRFIWRESMSHDVEKTKAFYGALFGWTFKTSDPGPSGPYVHIENDGKPIGGIMQMPPDTKSVPMHWASYVYVRDVDESIATAKGLGGKVHWGPMDIPNVGRMAGIAAFDGAALTVMKPSRPDQPHEALRPPVGAFCWETLTTSDVDRSKTFWTRVLGWQASTGAGMPTFAVGDGMENQVADLQPAQGPVPPNWLTFVVVGKVETASEKATKLGGKVMMPAMAIPNVGRIGVVLDDQSAAIGLFEPGA